jgi:hypothetical protein
VARASRHDKSATDFFGYFYEKQYIKRGVVEWWVISTFPNSYTAYTRVSRFWRIDDNQAVLDCKNSNTFFRKGVC